MTKCKAQNTSSFHEPMKQNGAYVLLMKGVFSNEHIVYMGIALFFNRLHRFEGKLVSFSEVWVHSLYHSVLFALCLSSKNSQGSLYFLFQANSLNRPTKSSCFSLTHIQLYPEK